MVMYRPGSTTEKSQLLKRVEAPEAANNVSEAVDHLRQWSRYFKRAKDLKLSTPDPSILLKALDGLVRRPLQEHQDITFRMSLLRYHLKVDFAPTEDSIMAMQRAYLAEFEQMGYRKYKPGGGHQHQQLQPRIKAAELPPGTIPMPTPSPKAGSRPCKFFLSDDGCRRGKDCKYEHSMNSMSKAEKRERCYVCGAKGHMSSNCPTKTKDQKPVVAAVQGDSPQSSTGGTTNKKGQGGNRSEASTDAGSLTSSTSTPLAATTVPTQLSEVQGVPVEQLLEDAQKLMKAFMQQATPTAKAMRIRGAEWDELPALRELDADGGVISRKMGLLDSGATHAMRPRTPNDELRPTRTAEVTLAGDQKMEFPQTSSGVILAAPEAQPIVPLGSLIRALGYEFVWGRKGCVLRHPERPDVKVYDKSSCPEVRECDALRLIAELESAKVGEAMKSLEVLRAAIQVSKQRQPWDWWDAVKRYINEGTMDYGNQAVLAAPFMAEVPVELRTQVLEAIPGSGQEAWKALKHMPFNRAKRRALWKSDSWIIHMFAGEKFPGDPLQHGPGELLELDLRRGTSLMNPEVYGVLLWAAKHRKIKHIVGGPPSKTYSPLRGRDDLKALEVVRSAEELWGVGEGLQWEDRVMVSSENRMILKMVWLWIVAEAAMCNREQPQYSKVGLCMEHPEDPRLYLPPGEIADRSVFLWRTTFIEGMVNAFGLEETAFDQGALGNPQRRPTRCLTNLELGLRGLRDSRTSWPRPVRGEDPSVWSHGFREALCSAMKLWSRAMETDATTKAMSAKEKGEWKEHLTNNHFPYRRDCSVCLQASGTGRPARKVEHRDAFVLSLDVAGPFAIKGVDENRGSKHRFVLVGSYTFPKIKDIPAEEEPVEEEQHEEEFFQIDELDVDEGVELPEDPSLDEQEKEWERTVGELKKPVEMQTLKFCVPVEHHRGREVLDAVQSFYLTLRAMGMPLNRIHSDRGREFRVKPLRRWCRERDIAQTFTEGLKPTQNGSAENCVRWFKSQARLLLVAGKLDKKFWPGAMRAAADRYNRRQLGWKPPPMKFGQVVWVKSKKDLGPFDPRWECGRYMGPADDVREGHVVRLDDGTWMRTLSMRIMRDEEYEEQAEDDEGEYVVDHVEPGRRVRGKTTLRDPEVRAVAIASLSRPELVRRILSSGLWCSEEARVTRPQMKEGFMWDGAAYMSLGAYQYGGRNGITNATYAFPEETAWAAELLRRDHPGYEFSSNCPVKTCGYAYPP